MQKSDKIIFSALFLSIFTAGTGVGIVVMLIGSVAAGLIMDMFRLREAFYSGAGIMALGMITFLFLTHNGNNHSRKCGGNYETVMS